MSDPTDIPNWLRIDERLTTSGKLTAPQVAELARAGVEVVVNLAPDSNKEALPGEGDLVCAEGMEYVHIPVAFDAPAEADFAAFCSVMQAHEGERVHVHCIVNARVSAFVYRYRRDVLGWDEQAARRDMERIWQPGGVWAAFIGDAGGVDRPHGPPRG